MPEHEPELGPVPEPEPELLVVGRNWQRDGLPVASYRYPSCFVSAVE